MTTIIEDKGAGFTIVENELVDVWLRVLGPGAFTVYLVLKRMCAGNSLTVFPNVTQSDWAEYSGMSPKTFRSHLDKLAQHGLLVVREPSVDERKAGVSGSYALLPTGGGQAEEEDLPPKLSDKCKFNDMIYCPGNPLLKSKGKNYPTTRGKITAVQGEKLPFNKSTSKSTKKNLTKKRSRTVSKENSSPPEQSDSDRTYSRLSSRLQDIVRSSGRITGNQRTNQWPEQFRKLHAVDRIPLTRINTVMDWYGDNIGGAFVPECFCARSFREKFAKLEAAMTRKEPVRPGRKRRNGTNLPEMYKTDNVLIV